MKPRTYWYLTLALAAGLAACGDDDDDTPDACEGAFPAAGCPTEIRESSRSVGPDNVEATFVTVRDFGQGTGTATWTNDNTYVLDGLVFVNEGQTLTIEAGTVIQGTEGEGEDASALVVARGGTIVANGTADDPIIFTSVVDETYSTPAGLVTTDNLEPSQKGLWGGVIVLGRATLNSTPGTSAIEGIATSEERGAYGGSDDGDDSGTLRYVSIRHGGTDIGAGNEINGLTMGGVGSGTTVEYVEVYANSDDGFEWFGGTVNTKYLVSGFCGDDAMDYDEGWRGLNQFWVVYQSGDGDRGGEHDGGTEPETGTPFATPVIANASYFGQGVDAGARLLTFRDNAGGKYYNSLFVGYGKGVDIEYVAGGQDSYQQFVDGNLAFANNLLWEIGSDAFVLGGTEEDIAAAPADAQENLDVYFANNGNTTGTDPMLNGGLVPAAGAMGIGDVFAGGDLDAAFFDDADYKGAIAPGTTEPWAAGWTATLDQL